MKSKLNFHMIVWIICIFLFDPSVNTHAQNTKKQRESKRAAFRILLTDIQRETYDLITDSAALADWESRYWKAVDPTPTTPENENYQEHLRRFDYSRKYYSNIISPLYIDDRGRYYIRFGEPDDFSDSVGLGMNYRNNVTWVYYGFNLFIDFVEKEAFGYQEVNDLSEAVIGVPQNQKAIIAATLYSERENLHVRYAKFRSLRNSRDVQAVNNFYFTASELVQEKEVALATTPPFDYKHDYRAKPLSAIMQAANFRDINKKTRIEFYFSVPLKEITFTPGETFPLESALEKRISIIDREGDEIVNRTEELPLVANSLDQVRNRVYVNQHNEILEPGLYNVSLRLENIQGKRLAILKAQLMVKDFVSSDLQLSDLELASQIRDGAAGRHVKPNGILAVPYLPRTLKKEVPLYVYFEIYNLLKDGIGFTQYEVNYTIKTLKEQRNILAESAAKIASFLVGGQKTTSVATSFDGSGTSDFQQIYLSIDFGNAPDGRAELLVQVTDKISGQHANSRMIFTLK